MEMVWVVSASWSRGLFVWDMLGVVWSGLLEVDIACAYCLVSNPGKVDYFHCSPFCGCLFPFPFCCFLPSLSFVAGKSLKTLRKHVLSWWSQPRFHFVSHFSHLTLINEIRDTNHHKNVEKIFVESARLWIIQRSQYYQSALLSSTNVSPIFTTAQRLVLRYQPSVSYTGTPKVPKRTISFPFFLLLVVIFCMQPKANK